MAAIRLANQYPHLLLCSLYQFRLRESVCQNSESKNASPVLSLGFGPSQPGSDFIHGEIMVSAL